MKAPLLQARHLAWSWSGRAPRALDDVSLELRPGQLTALVGPNGSGKSTLLALLAGVRAPQTGIVTHDGAPAPTELEALARRVAFLPARPLVPPELTGLEVALLGRHPFGRGLLVERPDDMARAEAALLRAGAAAFRDRPLDALSSGERQRVLVARALCQDVPVLLLDEPTSAQDPAHALDLFQLFSDLARKEGRTVVVATHDLNSAARFADRLVALRDGRVRADGPPAAVLAAGPLADVFDVEAVLGTDGDAPYAVARARAGASAQPPAPAPAPTFTAPVPAPTAPASEPARSGLHPALLIGGAALLLALALLLAPLVTRTANATDDLHRPRAVLGALAGCALAACGVVLQSVLRNPLAEPYTLGISSGASVGAALAIHLGAALPALVVGVPPTFIGAVAGALLASWLVQTIAARRELAAETLLLAGVAVALFCGAIVAFLHFLASTIDLFAMIRWTMGSLSTAGWSRVHRMWPLVAAGLALCAAVASRLAPASLDDDSARSLGVDPVWVRRLAFAGTSLATAGVVAAAGPIGFVGLIVPHAARALTGSDPRVLLPVATLLGGATLVAADVLARSLVYPVELPISVITHALGCPAFVWILIRRR